MYTTSAALLEALVDAGVSHLFVNLGSDHPALVEAISKRRLDDNKELRVLTAPNEFVGLCAAQGYYQVSNKMQAILVHVDAGTLAMAGAVHNVSRARIPVLMIAGTSPITEEGELRGSRNEFIHYLQDTQDQRFFRGYTVFDHEIRRGCNVKQNIMRAAQLAQSEPQGPAYLTASRECLEEEIKPYRIQKGHWKPLAPTALASETVDEIANALMEAKMPVIITTYLGRDPTAVPILVALSEMLSIPVIEALPANLNFPHDHAHYMGSQWSQALEGKSAVLDEADVVLIVDCDVPYIKSVFRPPPSARIFHIDTDPLKVQMSLFHVDCELSCRANSKIAIEQLNTHISKSTQRPSIVNSRATDLRERHEAYMAKTTSLCAKPSSNDRITPHFALSVLRAQLDPTTIILSEGISNYRPVADVMCPTLPGSYFTSGATALGWHGGAALGAKLASPERTVVSITGDGSFLFSLPENVHWMAARYKLPFLTVILNNRGWKSPMLSAIAVHKEGYTSQLQSSDDLHVTFDPPPNHAGVAVAAGAGFGRTVKKVDELEDAFRDALKVVREEGRAAVVDVWLPKFEVGDVVG